MPESNAVVLQTDLPLPGRRQGKVRDIYDAKTTAGDDVLLIVQTDRISAFDVVMPNGIPDKGKVLTQLSKFWFDMIGEKLGDQLEHHLISTDPADVDGLSDADVQTLRGQVMVGRKAKVIPIECIVRGYLAGSGWKEYKKQGTVCGISLPKGLKQCQKLPEPIFTPSTKADEGHDENVTFEQACDLVGKDLMEQLRELSLTIYQMAHDYAVQRGIILADTKFEFGLPLDGKVDRPILIDEVLTPDSSRFWPADSYEVGHDQPSFDKQYVRNYLQELVDAGRWKKEPPGPELPEEIVANTRSKYLDAYRRLTDGALNI
ncbi:phosphoribosylaminoimidazolesuccinocarboxamide synthase [Phycisphaerales bacterium AB-hyl4]|uniref:Phosphoribosylaminoimidazole-succinocarboxamide synthase n=1 Tax=Natronomicrosphaera hydrolytica TaxID=3242702 RepID=A0ABV4TZD8_9BACT